MSPIRTALAVVASYTVDKMFGLPPSEPATLAQPRYPKRKRAEVQYYDVDDEEETSENEKEIVPYKRPKISNKPLPKHKIFPFLSLPGEIRNKIYEECLPSPTEVPKQCGEEPALWFGFRMHQHRRTIEYLPTVVGSPQWSYRWEYSNSNYRGRSHGTARGAGRGRAQAADPSGDNSESESGEEEERCTKPLAFNVLSVCKQIYEEAAPMMYNRKFVFTCPEALSAFAAQLSPSTAKLVRHIELCSWGTSRSRKNCGYMAMTLLGAKGVTNLEILNLNCSLGYDYSYNRNEGEAPRIMKRLARKVYRDFYVWLEAVGHSSGEWDKGVRVLTFNGEKAFQDGMEIYQKELKRLLSVP